MFASPIDYSCAVSDQTDEGQDAALRWVLDHREDGELLTVWVAQKSILTSNDFARSLASRRDVQVAVGRGAGYFAARGPVLALYAAADDLGKITIARGITALCVVQWSDRLRTWMAETGATVLHELDLDEGDPDFFGAAGSIELAPAVVKVLKSMTKAIHHNNTIGAGYEKEVVVRGLLRLHHKGVGLPGQEMKEWAAAHGWRHDMPKRLAEFADRINKGTRPRLR